MKRQVGGALTVLALLAPSVVAVVAAPETPIEPLPDVQFTPVRIDPIPTPTEAPAPIILDYAVAPPRKPRVEQPTTASKQVPKGSALPVTPALGNAVVNGKATWYCKAGVSICHYRYPDRPGAYDPYAAAGSEIRIGDWRGRRVSVCRTEAPRKCIVVTLVDWCACKGNRIIDLYWDAFDALNVRGETGGVKVRISW